MIAGARGLRWPGLARPAGRARLNRQWAQGLMCIRAAILNPPKNLKVFDELSEHINQCWQVMYYLTVFKMLGKTFFPTIFTIFIKKIFYFIAIYI